ncbi:hypothetical protein V8E53_001358 [Lactarius tabidus]
MSTAWLDAVSSDVDGYLTVATPIRRVSHVPHEFDYYNELRLVTVYEGSHESTDKRRKGGKGSVELVKRGRDGDPSSDTEKRQKKVGKGAHPIGEKGIHGEISSACSSKLRRALENTTIMGTPPHDRFACPAQKKDRDSRNLLRAMLAIPIPANAFPSAPNLYMSADLQAFGKDVSYFTRGRSSPTVAAGLATRGEPNTRTNGRRRRHFVAQPVRPNGAPKEDERVSSS